MNCQMDWAGSLHPISVQIAINSSLPINKWGFLTLAKPDKCLSESLIVLTCSTVGNHN